MQYTYRVHRDVYIDVVIEAEDEFAAQEAYDRMEESGELNYLWRDAALEVDSDVEAVWEEGLDGRTKIYSAR